MLTIRTHKGHHSYLSHNRVFVFTELASSKVQQDQLQREVKQLQVLAAEKDSRLAESAAQAQQMRQQVEQLRDQLQQAGGSRSNTMTACMSVALTWLVPCAAHRHAIMACVQHGACPADCLVCVVCAEASARQQPHHLQQQVSQLTQQLHVVQQRAEAKEASSKKYKEAVKAFKVRLLH